MKFRHLHDWNVTPKAAVALQRKLANRVVADKPLTNCEYIAGADVSCNRFSRRVFAGVVVIHVGDGAVIERRGVQADSLFPYIPGLLSFREAPALLDAFALLDTKPDAVICDGQGLAHPRRLGIASHIGLWLNVPTIGCAKSRLVGKFEEPGTDAGSTSPLWIDEEQIGEVVRTKRRTKPLFISVGHKIDQASATRWVLATCRGYRLPEPTRQAHLFVNELRRAAL